MTILVVDNYDSFTYNLVAVLAEAGAQVSVRRNDRLSVNDALRGGWEGVLISPGPGTPATAGISLELVRRAAGRVPILGVCLGHQVLAEAFGGTIVSAPELVHGKSSSIHHDGRTVFQGLPDPFPATRYHSLTVESGSLPETLEISARTSSGIVMAIRHRTLPLEGVQFHPESILTRSGHRLLENWFAMLSRGE